MTDSPQLYMRAGRAVDIGSISIELYYHDVNTGTDWASEIASTGLPVSKGKDGAWSTSAVILAVDLENLDQNDQDSDGYIIRLAIHPFNERKAIHASLELTTRPKSSPPQSVLDLTRSCGGVFDLLEKLGSALPRSHSTDTECIYLMATDRWSLELAGFGFPPTRRLNQDSSKISIVPSSMGFKIEGHDFLVDMMIMKFGDDDSGADDSEGLLALNVKGKQRFDISSSLFHDLDRATWSACLPFLTPLSA